MLELQDFFLDGAFGDQAVGEDVAGLADAVGAVDGLGFDGGVPPGVEQEDVVGAGEVEAEAAGLEADQEEPGVGIVLELLDGRFAVAGFAVEIGVADGVPAVVEAFADDGQEAGELGEDQGLVAFVEDFVELRRRGCRVWRRASPTRVLSMRPGWQAAWRRRSRASRTCMRLVPVPSALPAAEQRLAVMLAQFVVEARAATHRVRSRWSARCRGAGPGRPVPWCGGG